MQSVSESTLYRQKYGPEDRCRRCAWMLVPEDVFCPHCGREVHGQNTSGMGATSTVPKEVKGWSCGAFFLGAAWGVPNKVWSSLFGLLPIACFFMPFLLGARGNEWAWQSRKWESVDHFRRSQRKWMYWGIASFVVTVASAIASLMLIMQIMDMYRQIMA
jgi:hypothetical protein